MRYVEVVGGMAVTGYDLPKMKIGEFTRENVAKFLEVVLDPVLRPIEDFHAVYDGMEIPWATEEARETYRHVMELAAEKRRMEPPTWIDRQFFSANISEFLLLSSPTIRLKDVAVTFKHDHPRIALDNVDPKYKWPRDRM